MISLETLKINFAEQKTWEDRFRLIIQLGKTLPKPSEAELATMINIEGCEAKVWFAATKKDENHFSFNAYSEARITNGLLAIILIALQNQPHSQLAGLKLNVLFEQLGITHRLGTTRLNGLKQIETIINGLT